MLVKGATGDYEFTEKRVSQNTKQGIHNEYNSNSYTSASQVIYTRSVITVYFGYVMFNFYIA